MGGAIFLGAIFLGENFAAGGGDFPGGKIFWGALFLEPLSRECKQNFNKIYLTLW